MSSTTAVPPTSARSAAAPPGDHKTWLPGIFTAAGVGLVAVALAIGAAELLSALGGWIGVLDANSSPINALGSAFINLTPEWLKEFAIRTFGQHDKDALRVSMLATLVIVSLIVGVVARRSPRIAVGVTVVLVAVTLVAVYTRTGTGVADGLPILIGGALGVVFLVAAFRRTVADAVPADVGAHPVTAAEVAGPRGTSRPAQGATDVGRDITSPDTVTVDPKNAHSGSRHPMARSGAAPAAVTQVNQLGRRRFFQVAGIGLLAAAAAGAVSRWIPSAADVATSRATAKVPQVSDPASIPAGTDLNVPGQPPYITPNANFYRVDTAFSLPNLPADEWKLKVHGMVDKEIDLDYQALTARPQIERTITLTCVSNQVGGDLAGNATWIGTRIADLLAEAGPTDGADCVLCTSIDGFTLTAPLQALTDGRDALLAVAMNGEVLPQVHGFPVRMVVPGLYGYVSATKWVVDMELTKFSDVTGYWTKRGWDAQAPIKTASRIDVPKGFATATAGQPFVIAGVAWAQHRGIDKVQVQIDNGDWADAELGEKLSKDTWVQWKYSWPAVKGLHTIRCRAIDATGAVQIEKVQTPIPNGSTGYDSRSVTVS